MGKGAGSGSATIGYKYYMGMHMVICHGPVDELQRIDVGERAAWSGSVTGNGSIYVDNPELFGGEKKEGGVQGTVDILMGGPTQAKNNYLKSILGNVIPAFRGVFSVVLNQCYLTAMSPYPKAWSFLVKRIPGKTWYPEKADISGSANGAHIIYEVLTNTQWGMGYSLNTIDDASFRSVADKLYAEGLGLSFELNSGDSLENFIGTVVKHINGIFYVKPDTGKFALKLLRNDYTISSLPLFNEDNITKLESFERPSYGEMVNEIVVVYRPRGTLDDDSVTIQDLASVQAQEGIVSQSVNYPGIDNATNAARVAMRDLRQQSTPLARVKLKVLRSAWNKTIGDCIKFSWAEHGVSNMVLRILSVNTGTVSSGEISLNCVEDVFGLPSATYIGNQTSSWTDPVVAPSSAEYRRLFEVPYWSIARNTSEANFAYLTNSSAFLSAAIGYPSTLAINYELWTRPNTGNFVNKGNGDFCPHCQIGADITPIQTTLTCSNFRGNTSLVAVGSFAVIEDEIVRVDSINVSTGIVTVGRGCLDTVPKSHVNTSRMYFVDDFAKYDTTEYLTGDTVNCKELTRTGSGQLPIASAPQDNLTMVGRFSKPYPPGNVRLSGTSYPATVVDDLVITWAHRDRTQQLASIIDHTAANIGPETGTTYSLQIIDPSDNSIMEQSLGMTGTSFTSSLFFSTKTVKVKLWSSVSGRTSYQSVEYTFVLNNPQNILTEAGEFFLAEDGSYIIL